MASGCREGETLIPLLYETTDKQNTEKIEHRTLNVQHRIMNFVNFKKTEQSELALRKNSDQHSTICLSKKDKAWRHPYWTFDVRRS